MIDQYSKKNMVVANLLMMAHLEEVKALAMGTVMEEKEALVIREILHGSYPQKRNIVSKACFQKNAS